jgi:uncharacterized protein YlxW (UPF0749 family)
MQDVARRNGGLDSPVGTRDGAGEERGVVRRRTSWLLTLSGVCFVFGGLLAVQLRAMQTVQLNREQSKLNIVLAQEQATKLRSQMEGEKSRRAASEIQVKELTRKLSETGSLSKAQIGKLRSEFREVQGLAGLTEVQGPGVRLTIDDNPQARQFTDPSGFGPGMVHDFDLQGIVNELRVAKAEAIAIRGAGGPLIRVTGFTPIRCVGPVIQINYEPVATPFVIEAIGEQGTLESALNLPDGIVDGLRAPKNGMPALPIKIERIDAMALPAGENVPKFRKAKVQ